MPFIVLSTVAYGLLPVLAKVAYAGGLGPVGLLASRFVLATLLFVAAARHAPGLPWRRRLLLWGLGAVFFGNSFTYFKALEAAPASLVAVLFYTNPVVVGLLSAAVGLDRLTLRDAAAGGLAFLGTALTARGLAQGASTPGVVLSLAAALIYSVYVVLAGRFGATTPSEAAARHVAQACAVLFLIWAVWQREPVWPPTPAAWGAVLGIAVVCTVVALRAFLAGLARVGPARAAVGSALELVVTVVLAVTLLGEDVSLAQWLGAALILAAVALQNLGSLRRSWRIPVRRAARE